jgi:hypothetical protein
MFIAQLENNIHPLVAASSSCPTELLSSAEEKNCRILPKHKTKRKDNAGSVGEGGGGVFS